jgi:hypothetical protein
MIQSRRVYIHPHFSGFQAFLLKRTTVQGASQGPPTATGSQATARNANATNNGAQDSEIHPEPLRGRYHFPTRWNELALRLAADFVDICDNYLG